MSFYQMTKLGVGDLKTMIREAQDPSKKRKTVAALWAKNILCILFALLFIGGISGLFGADNNTAGVVIFCILMTVQFVDFGYDISSSLFTLAIVFATITFGPILASLCSPGLATAVNFGCILLILLLTSMKPENGNQGIYVLSYLLMQGFPVKDHALFLRIVLMSGGCLLCCFLFYRAHHKKTYALTGKESLRRFSLSSSVSRWQLKMAMAISLVLLVGQMMGLPRTMWLGIACMSVLQMESKVVKERLFTRIPFVALGSLFFGLLAFLCPDGFFPVFGILGGLCAGFCTSYRWKTMFNCFGALVPATLLHGPITAVLLRICMNLSGAAFAFLFYHIFDKALDFFSSQKKQYSSSNKREKKHPGSEKTVRTSF